MPTVHLSAVEKTAFKRCPSPSDSPQWTLMPRIIECWNHILLQWCQCSPIREADVAYVMRCDTRVLRMAAVIVAAQLQLKLWPEEFRHFNWKHLPLSALQSRPYPRPMRLEEKIVVRKVISILASSVTTSCLSFFSRLVSRLSGPKTP